MDKEQVILQRLEQLRLEQLKALKELKKVEKAKKKKRRRTAHGYPLKDESYDQKKNLPCCTVKSIQCMTRRRSSRGSTPGQGKVVFDNTVDGDDNKKYKPPKCDELTNLSPIRRKTPDKTSSKSVTERPKKKLVTVLNNGHHNNLMSHTGVSIESKTETRNVELDPTTVVNQEYNFTPSNRSVTAKENERTSILKVTKQLGCISTDSDLSSVVQNRVKTMSVIKDVPSETESGYEDSGSTRISPKQSKEDVSMRFPKPDDCLLRATGQHLLDFVLPDTDFAVLKLEKLKQAHWLCMKESGEARLGINTNCKLDSADDSLTECTQDKGDCEDVKNRVDSTDGLCDKGNECTLKSEKQEPDLESFRGESSGNSTSHHTPDGENILSESILAALVADQDFSYAKNTQDSRNDCTLQEEVDENYSSCQHTASDTQFTQQITDSFRNGTLQVSNDDQDDTSTQQSSSNKFCTSYTVKNASQSRYSEKLKDSEVREKTEVNQVAYSAVTCLPTDMPLGPKENLGHRDAISEATLDAIIDDQSLTENDLNYATPTSQFRHSDGKIERSEPEMGENNADGGVEQPSLEFLAGDESFDDLVLVGEPFVTLEASSQFVPEVPSKEPISSRCNPTPEMIEICLQHVNTLPWCSNEVRAIKLLTVHIGDTTIQVIAVCLPRLLVLWKSVSKSKWIVLHKWMLDEEEEFFDLELTSVDSCIVIVTGGTFAKALGRVYCVFDRGDWTFDLCEEVSLSEMGETSYKHKDICLLPIIRSAENVRVVLASTRDEKILLTKWTIDLLCFCLENSQDFPELYASELSSLLPVCGSKCILLGCVDSDIYFWNYNSCEILWKTSLQQSTFCTPVCLSAETVMGMLFLVLLYKEQKTFESVVVNPQSCREACLKTLDIAHLVKDPSDRVLCYSKSGSHVIVSFTQGQILLWNIASDETNLLNPLFGDVRCISLDPQDSSIAFGTDSGLVYLNIIT